jgi:hypothetical protein
MSRVHSKPTKNGTPTKKPLEPWRSALIFADGQFRISLRREQAIDIGKKLIAQATGSLEDIDITIILGEQAEIVLWDL